MERRQYPRVTGIGVAVISTADRYWGTHLIKNISASGMLVAGPAMPRVGEKVQAMIELPSMGNRVTVDAQVTRHEGGNEFALTFTNPSSALELALKALESPATGRK